MKKINYKGRCEKRIVTKCEDINIVYCDLCLWAVACMCSFVYGKKRS